MPSLMVTSIRAYLDLDGVSNQNHSRTKKLPNIGLELVDKCADKG